MVKEGANSLLFDDRQLQRFGIADSALPEGSTVVNRPVSFYTEHRKLVWAVALFVILQTVVIVTLLLNIMRRRRAEEALKRSERKYRDIFENATEGIYQTTPSGRVLSLNPAAAAMLGYATIQEALDHVGDSVADVYADPRRRDDFMAEISEHGMVQGFEVEMVRRDGSAFWVSMNSRAVHDDAGRLLYIEGMLADITDRKRAEVAVVRAMQEAKAASRLKSDLLSSVSHELKTPLTSIVGFGRMLESAFERSVAPSLADDASTAKTIARMRDNLSIMLSQSEHLTQLIDNVLDLTELISGSMTMSLAPVDVREVVREAVAATRHLAVNKKLEQLSP